MLIISKVKELIEKKFNGNMSAFARAIYSDKGLVSRVLSNKQKAGIKTINRFITYCKKENINYSNYIFL